MEDCVPEREERCVLGVIKGGILKENMEQFWGSCFEITEFW